MSLPASLSNSSTGMIATCPWASFRLSSLPVDGRASGVGSFSITSTGAGCDNVSLTVGSDYTCSGFGTIGSGGSQWTSQRIDDMTVSYDNARWKHALFPLWISAFRYRDKVFRVVVNARTGEVAGERPWSVFKILLLIMFGRSEPMKPSSSISSKAFHIPRRPTPPPVG